MTLQFSGPTTVSLSIIPIFLSFMRHVFATRDHKPLCFNILYYRGGQVIFSEISKNNGGKYKFVSIIFFHYFIE